ncbi:MAG: hypothetical protein ACXW3Q_14665, partial [Rhodoplanes sp.]
MRAETSIPGRSASSRLSTSTMTSTDSPDSLRRASVTFPKNVRPGTDSLVTTAAAPDRTFAGKVVEVRRPATPQEGATVDVVIEAENPDLALRPGM